MSVRSTLCLLSFLALLSGATRPARADTLDDIRARGTLICAISDDIDDFSQFDAHGDLSAFSADLCRAVAAAVLPNGTRTKIIGTGDEITAVRDVADGRADIAFGTTPDPAIGVGLHLAYAPPALFDGQGFLINRDEAFTDLRSLAGKRICFIEGTPPEETLKSRFAALGIDFTAFPFSERGEMMGALATGHCNVVTGDVTELANQRLALPALARNGVIMAPLITTDPWSPVVRADARRLLAVMATVEYGLVSASERGITQTNAAARAASSGDPAVARLLGAGTWQARGLGVDERFLLRAIEAVGNSDELYRRDVGAGSRLELPVGANQPIPSGGALVDIPVEGER